MNSWKIVVALSLLLNLVATQDSSSGTFTPTCPNEDIRLPENIVADAKWTIFNQLSPEEINQIIDFLVYDMGIYYNQREATNIDGRTRNNSNANTLHRVELFEPEKSVALAFLDESGPRPRRFAKATVIRSINTPKDVMEYKIGPLPLQKGASKDPSKIGKGGDDSPFDGVVMLKLLKDNAVPFYKRPPNPTFGQWIVPAIDKTAYELREIFKDAIGWCYGVDRTNETTLSESTAECGKQNLDWVSYPALDRDQTKRVTQILWFFNPSGTNGEEDYLHPVPISFKLQEADSEDGPVKLFDFEYCHQGPFDSVKELLKAYKTKKVTKCTAQEWKDQNYDAGWSRTDNRHTPRPGSDKPAPRTFYPNGKRFRTTITQPNSGEGFHFEYLGWEGHVSIRLATGIVFHDIRFRGNRIVYELALQEQFVAYSGYGGVGQTIYMDSYFGLGLAALPLRKGVDCPESAEYLPMTKIGTDGTVVTTPNVICIFEEDGQSPEWRHTHIGGGATAHSDSVRRAALVIRVVATVGNYDYLYSVRFKPDASIQVETTLAGYMLSTFHDINGQTNTDAPFGIRVHKYTFALLHDHLSGWKVDLDVLGIKNSVHRQRVKVGTWEDAALGAKKNGYPAPPWHSGDYVKYLEREILEEEFGFSIKDPGTVVHSFINPEFKNSWGEPRGYSIAHGMTARQLLPDSHPFTKTAAWTKYHLAVTRRRDEEAFSHNAVYDMVAPADPLFSLDDYLDGEKIVEKDLVAWVMMGVIHIPRSEDIPLISNMGTSFSIKPWNYYDELVSTDFNNKQSFDSCYPLVGNLYSYRWLTSSS